MRLLIAIFAALLTVVTWGAESQTTIQTIVEYNPNETATSDFKFRQVRRPFRATRVRTPSSTSPMVAATGPAASWKYSTTAVCPARRTNRRRIFSSAPVPTGGRLLLDLGRLIPVRQVNTYSWHPGLRGPQVYRLYGSQGTGEGFTAQPQQDVDPLTCGWTLLGSVDTRPCKARAADSTASARSIPKAASGSTGTCCLTSRERRMPTRSVTRSTARSTYWIPMRRRWRQHRSPGPAGKRPLPTATASHHHRYLGNP